MAFDLEVDLDEDLIKARPHKYVKRTGTPGNYRYWYKLPDGRIVEGDEEGQKAGRKEHLQRLIAARAKGKHSMSNAEMVEHTGYHRDADGDTDAARKNKAVHNLRGFQTHMKRTGVRKLAASGGHTDDNHAVAHGHDFDDHHIDESHHHDTEAEEYRRTHNDGAHHEAVSTPVRARTRPRRTPAAPVEEVPAAEAPPAPRTRRPRTPRAAPAAPRTAVEATIADIEATDARRNASKLEALRAKLEAEFGINLGDDDETPNRDGEPEEEPLVPGMAEDIEAANSEPEHTLVSSDRVNGILVEVKSFNNEEGEERFTVYIDGEDQNRSYTSRLSALRAGGNIARRGGPAPEVAPVPRHSDTVATSQPTPAEQRAKVKAAAARAKALARAIGPDAPAAREMAAADPTFAADEAPIREAIARQAAGKNPYLERAKEIFDRIAPHIPEKNRISFQNFFDVLGDGTWVTGSPVSEAEVKAAYEAHRTPAMLTWAALKTAMPTYKGLYHDLNEILGNEPLNPEVERMKRGFGRKQFERMRPYIKNDWHLANRDAPPPFPTFGDLKSWNDFGSRPEWASPRAQLAVPKEVHDASPKDANGKVQLPPKWMPIHLSPLWNYASKIRSDYTANPSPNQVNGSSLNLDMGSDLGSQIMNSLRKYVQARGGASQLVDIPSQKLQSVGLSHNDIFKSDDHDLSDKAMQKIMTTKIIDPVAVAPFVEAELKPKEVKKSWALVADIRRVAPKVEEALVKSEQVSSEDLKKSELIKAIKAKKDKLAKIVIRG